MSERIGLQVVSLSNGHFNLIIETKERFISILGGTPPGYSQALWEKISRDSLQQIDNWVVDSFDEKGNGMIVLDGKYYDFDNSNISSKFDKLPTYVQEAFEWVQGISSICV